MKISNYLLRLKIENKELQIRRILAIDVGNRFNGLAMTLELDRIQLLGNQPNIERIVPIIKKNQIQAILLGENKNGNKLIDQFENVLETTLQQNQLFCFIARQNEDLSTVEANQIQYKLFGMVNKQVSDEIAASIILHRFIQKLRVQY
ncbi:hypothetical protein pb186bvf_000325 [Paramecium bursaria]